MPMPPSSCIGLAKNRGAERPDAGLDFVQFPVRADRPANVARRIRKVIGDSSSASPCPLNYPFEFIHRCLLSCGPVPKAPLVHFRDVPSRSIGSEELLPVGAYPLRHQLCLASYGARSTRDANARPRKLALHSQRLSRNSNNNKGSVVVIFEVIPSQQWAIIRYYIGV